MSVSELEVEKSGITVTSETRDITSLDGKSDPIVNLRNTYIAAASALLYVMTVGMVSSYPAPATVDMQRPGSRFINITPDQITWIASLPFTSGCFGNLFSGYVTQKLGRKAVLMWLSPLFVLSWLLIAYAPTVVLIYIGRLLGGFCCGMIVVTVPVYLAEIAPKDIRGMLTTWFHLAFSVGILLVMSLGIVLRWSWLAMSGAVLTTTAACLVVLMPESPPWLVRQGRTVEASDGLKFLRGKKYDPSKELQEMKDSNTDEQNVRISVRDVVDGAFYKPLGIAVSLMFFLNFCGFSPIISYTVEIIKETGSSVDPRVASSIVAAVQVVATFTSSMLMDRSGRRRLYITSGCFVAVSLLILGLYSFLSKKYALDLHLYGWIPLATLTVYIFTFSLGVGPIPWVITPELVSLRTRSVVLAIAGLSGSLFGFIVTKTFENMESSLDLYGVYWTYGFFTVMSILFGFFCLPETKGLTIYEIHKKFSDTLDSL